MLESPRRSPRLPTLCGHAVITAALCCVSLGSRLASAQQLPSAPILNAEIAAKGAKAVVTRLNTPPTPPQTHNAWDLVVGQIRLARPAYVQLSRKLAAGTDAGTSEDLAIALAFALPADPADVLSVVDLSNRPPLGVDRICGAPFIEDTIDNLPVYLRTAHLKVERISAPKLAPARAACLQGLDQATQHLPTHSK